VHHPSRRRGSGARSSDSSSHCISSSSRESVGVVHHTNPVDLVAGQWTKIRIEVDGERARLYVHGNEQPTLIVNDVKSGADASGGVALWLEPGTVAHFRNLTIKPR
jgi:hypothetical protein